MFLLPPTACALSERRLNNRRKIKHHSLFRLRSACYNCFIKKQRRKTMLNQEQIGAYIAARRKAVGLTQAELGERLGITAQSVSNWERGETMPDTGLLQDLALILDTSADELLGAGSCGWRYRRRVTVERMSEAISCIQRLRELLGEDHFMYRTMIDALDKR